MTTQLTPFIAKFAEAGLDAIKNKTHVAQIIQLAEIREGSGRFHRNGAIIDGQHAMRIIFFGSKEQLLGLQKYAVVGFKKVANTTQANVLMTTEWETKERLTKALANSQPHPKLPFNGPVPQNNQNQTNSGPPNTAQAPRQDTRPMPPKQQPPPQQKQVARPPAPNQPRPPPQIQQQPKSTPTPSQAKESNVIPINALNSYNPVWTIKARVTAKSDMRPFGKANAAKSGKLFSVDFIDKERNEIRAVAFNEAAEKWFHEINVGSVYLVSKGSLKQVQNKKFSPIKCDYEMTLNLNSIVEQVAEDKGIKHGLFDLVPLSQLAQCAKDTVVDVLGIAKDVSACEVQESKKQDSKATFKRTLKLVDKTTMVDLTIWGMLAQTNIAENDIIVVKHVRVSDYNGKTLGTSFDSSIMFEPEDDTVMALRGWLNGQDPDTITSNAHNLTVPRGPSGSGVSYSNTIMTIKEKRYGDNEKEFASVKATIVNIRKEGSLFYEACPRPDCKGKKVLFDSNTERYNCQKCNQAFTADDIDYKYVLNFCIADYTGSMWVSAFSAAQSIIKREGREMHDLQVTNDDEFKRVLSEAEFKEYNFSLACEANEYNGAVSTRYTAQKVFEVDSLEKDLKRAFARVVAYGYDIPNQNDTSVVQ